MPRSKLFGIARNLKDQLAGLEREYRRLKAQHDDLRALFHDKMQLLIEAGLLELASMETKPNVELIVKDIDIDKEQGYLLLTCEIKVREAK
jgi:hypothetical protein